MEVYKSIPTVTESGDPTITESEDPTVTESGDPTRRGYHYNRGPVGISGVTNKVTKKYHRHK